MEEAENVLTIYLFKHQATCCLIIINPCCICGIMIKPNGANMCVQCLSEKANITGDISRQEVLRFCNKCGRYI